MVSHNSRPGPRKKSTRKKKANAPILDAGIVVRVRRQMDEHWPNLGRQLASLIRVSREKFEDFYSAAAQAISEHKEAFEDRRAENKAHAQAATAATQQKNIPRRR